MSDDCRDLVQELRKRADQLGSLLTDPQQPHPDAKRFRAAAIERLQARPAGVAVKPLEWLEPSGKTNGCWVAESILGTYSVVFEDGWCAVLEDGFGWEWEPENDPRSYEGPKAAKDACQAHLGTQVLAALAPADPAPVSVGAAARVAHLERVLEPFNRMAGELFARNYDAPDEVLRLDTPDGQSVVLDFADFLCVRDALGEPKP